MTTAGTRFWEMSVERCELAAGELAAVVRCEPFVPFEVRFNERPRSSIAPPGLLPPTRFCVLVVRRGYLDCRPWLVWPRAFEERSQLNMWMTEAG